MTRYEKIVAHQLPITNNQPFLAILRECIFVKFCLSCYEQGSFYNSLRDGNSTDDRT
ncbi:hypothetical protein IQ272_28805 [Chroococcidiopsidales cyanobacterium LEGE 13417]|nr:hypothetical protein [Chroococcidiopsidales cyanobacterium LEGE 13417]